MDITPDHVNGGREPTGQFRHDLAQRAAAIHQLQHFRRDEIGNEGTLGAWMIQRSRTRSC